MGLGSILGDIISPLTGGGKGGVLGKLGGGGSSILGLLTSFIAGGAHNPSGTILPAALNMLFGGHSMSEGIAQPLGTGGMQQAQERPGGNGQQPGQPGALPSLTPAQSGAAFAPTASPKLAHSMAWYPGDPNAPLDPSLLASLKKPTPAPYDFNSYFGGMQ